MGSKDTAAAALRVALTPDRDEENKVKDELKKSGCRVAAVNFGGDFIASVGKIIEHTIVAAKREGVISDAHGEEGAAAGAAREALNQIMTKAMGFNVGGKIAITRQDGHVCVAMFFAVGLVHLNEVAVGLGHRSIC